MSIWHFQLPLWEAVPPSLKSKKWLLGKYPRTLPLLYIFIERLICSTWVRTVSLLYNSLLLCLLSYLQKVCPFLWYSQRTSFRFYWLALFDFILHPFLLLLFLISYIFFSGLFHGLFLVSWVITLFCSMSKSFLFGTLNIFKHFKAIILPRVWLWSYPTVSIRSIFTVIWFWLVFCILIASVIQVLFKCKIFFFQQCVESWWWWEKRAIAFELISAFIALWFKLIY